MYYPGIPSEGKWRDRKKKALVEVKTPPLAGIRHHGGNDTNFALSFGVRDVGCRRARRKACQQLRRASASYLTQNGM